MKISFFADSDFVDLSEGVSQYEAIWSEDGARILEAWERYTKLKFAESFINAVVFDGSSCSHPLSLRSSHDLVQKRISLVHELGHRILFRRVPGMKKVPRVAHHYLLFLVLGDILEELYGSEALDQAIAFDKSLPGFRADRYAEAWDWARGFSAEERKSVFQQILQGRVELFDLEVSE